jgi:hypothetical protein
MNNKGMATLAILGIIALSALAGLLFTAKGHEVVTKVPTVQIVK